MVMVWSKLLIGPEITRAVTDGICDTIGSWLAAATPSSSLVASWPAAAWPRSESFSARSCSFSFCTFE